MPLMLSALYEALKGLDEEKARKAAEEVASYDNRLTSIEIDIRYMKWAITALIPLIIGLYFK